MAVTIKYNNELHKEFTSTLKQRVDEFFKTNKLSKYGGNAIVIKAIVFTVLYLGAYAMIMTNLFNVYQMWVLSAVIGFAAAGIGMGYMHDANHGSFSKNKKVNKLFGFSMELLGGCRHYPPKCVKSIFESSFFMD